MDLLKMKVCETSGKRIGREKMKKDLVDVDGVGLLPLVLLLLLVALGDGLGGLAGLLGSFSRDLGRHDDWLVGSDVLSEDDRSGQV